MRWFKLVLLAGAVLGMAGAQSASAVAEEESVYSFRLVNAKAVSPNGGMMAAPGDWISVSGSGTFDPLARTIHGGGTFTHYRLDGTVMCQGTWDATAFTSFAPSGAADDAREGGVLSLVVTHHCTLMGMTMTGIPMTIASGPLPRGSTAVPGITVCDFSRPAGGFVVIESED